MTFWGGADPSSPSGFNWGYVGTSGGEFNTWEMRGQYEPGRKAGATTLPPFPFTSLIPTGVTCTPGNGQVTLHWTAPETFPNDSVINYYSSAYPLNNPQSFAGPVNAVTADGVTLSVVVSQQIINGITYTFNVFSHSTDGNSQNSVLSGPVTPYPQVDGPHIGGLPVITNIEPDLGFESGIAGQITLGTGTIDQSQAVLAYYGTECLHVTATASGDGTIAPIAAASPLTTYTVSRWYFRTETIARWDLQVNRQDDGVAFVQHTIPAVLGWQRFSVTFTTDASTTGLRPITHKIGDDGSLRDIYINAPQTELGPGLGGGTFGQASPYLGNGVLTSPAGAGGGGGAWGGADPGSAPGFSYGFVGGDASIFQERWEKYAAYAFTLYYHAPSPPITLVTYSPTGGIVLGNRVVSGAAQQFLIAVAVTLGSRTVAGAAQQQLATGTVTLGSRIAASAAQEQAATGAVVLGNRLVAGVAVETFTAAGAVVLGNLVVSGVALQQTATGAVLLGNRLVVGAAVQQRATGVVVLGDRLVAGAAVETFTAVGAVVLGNLVISGAAQEQAAMGAVILGSRLVAGTVLEQMATGAVVLGNRLVAAAALETFLASGALVLGNRLVTGAALQQVVSSALVLGSRVVTGAALEIFQATGVLVLGDRLIAGAALEQTITGAVVLGDRLVAGVAVETFQTTGALVLGNRLIVGTALEQTAMGAVVLGDRFAAGTAVETFLATGAVVLGDRGVAGAALEIFQATGAIVLGDRIVAILSPQAVSATGAVVLGDRLGAGIAGQLGESGSIVLGDRLVSAAALRHIFVAAQTALAIEQLGGLAQSAALPLGAFGQLQQQNPFGLEARGIFARSLVLPIEGMRGMAGMLAAQLESLQGLRRSSGLGLELSGVIIVQRAVLTAESAGNICFVSWVDADGLAALLGMPLAQLLAALLNGDLTLITREHLLALRKAGCGPVLIIPQKG